MTRRRIILLVISVLTLLILLVSAVVASSYGLYRYTIKERSDSAEFKSPVEEPEKTIEEGPESAPNKISVDEDMAEPEQDQQPQATPTEPSLRCTQYPKTNYWDYPDNIITQVEPIDPLSVVVNKKCQLPATYVPPNLTSLDSSGLPFRFTREVYASGMLVTDLQQLGEAARTAGLDLSIVSGYRSYQTQASTYQYWVGYNGGSVAAADTVSARPGHSQHQLGTTVDFSSSEVGDQIGAVFHGTQAASWLSSNAWRYGFILAYPEGQEKNTGYAYESWHYRYIGRELATSYKDSGDLTLDAYLDKRDL